MSIEDKLDMHERYCAWCPEPNILEDTNDSQYVFPFYYELIKTPISHGICNYCDHEMKKELAALRNYQNGN